MTKPFSLMPLFQALEQQRIDALPRPLHEVEQRYDTSRLSKAETKAFYKAWQTSQECPNPEEREVLMAPYAGLIRDYAAARPGVQQWGLDNFGKPWLEPQSVIDAYDSGFYRLKDAYQAQAPKPARQSFLVLDTYGDEDSMRHEEHMLIYTPCLFYFDKAGGRIIGGEVADLVLTETGQVAIRHHHRLTEPLPGWLTKAFQAGELGGKRAFYFSPQKGHVSVRCSEGTYVRATSYQDPSRPVGNPNLSGTRLLFPFEPVRTPLPASAD